MTLPFSSDILPSARNLFKKHCLPFTNWLMSGLDIDGRMEMLSVMLAATIGHGYQDAENSKAFFNLSQSMGYHVTADHFYSPIPNTANLPEDLDSRRFDCLPALNLNLSKQLELLTKLGDWAHEMKDTPRTHQNEFDYCWFNSKFCFTDAAIYHSMIRMLRPAQVLEIGAGYSTMVSTRAARLNGNTRVRCIEPYPIDALKNCMPGLDELIATPLQSVSPAEFDSLGQNDILFVDSTHISKAASDVNYIMFNILPRLKAGVIVHFHDIFLPMDYPRKYLTEHRLFWNEQYLLLAFLLFNPRVEVLLGAHHLVTDHPQSIAEAFPFVSTFVGSSFWLKVTQTAQSDSSPA